MAVSSWKMSLIILLSLSQGIICQSIEISPKYQIAKVGEAVTLMCKVSKKVQYCRFEFHGENALSLGPTKKVDSDIIYAGAGFDKGECGATLKRAAERHNGLVKCTVGLFDETVEPWATMNLVIAHTPSPPELHLIEDNNRYYKEGDTLLATCAVKNGRPVANITWYIDDQAIVDGLSTDVITVKEELHTILQNVSHVIVASDDGKQLRCVADHPGLSAANNYAQQIINVQYKPKPLDEPLEHFGLVEGAEGRIAVVVQANPKPTFYWTIGNKEYYEENHDDRFSVQKSVHKEDGSWESVLVINSLTKEDVEQNYGLTATNELGVTTYQVKISTSPRPKVLEIGTETIIIVIVAVFLLAIMFVTVFYARSRGQWCFAGPSRPRLTAESSDTESAEHNAADNSPKRGFASVFKIKSDKVGADMMVLKDITVDDEKAITVEPDSPQEFKDINEGVVYAELDLQAHRSGPTVVRGDDDKTEYAEIIHSKQK